MLVELSLSGVVDLDLTQVMADPVCGTLLGRGLWHDRCKKLATARGSQVQVRDMAVDLGGTQSGMSRNIDIQA